MQTCSATSMPFFGQELEKQIRGKPNGEARLALHQKLGEKMVCEGLKCLEQRRFDQLDPLVGDTACQTRALEMAVIYRRYLKEGDLSPRDRRFIGLCYFLTQTFERDKLGRRRTEYKRVRNFSGLSKKEAPKAVKEGQKVLARLSVERIEAFVKGLKGLPLAKEVLVEKCRRLDSFKRPLLPCYFTAKVMLRAEKQAKRPVRLQVHGPDGTRFYYFPKKPEKREVLMELEVDTKVEQEEFEAALNAHGFETLLLTNGAQHAQYGSHKVQPQTIPVKKAQELIEEEAELALKIGTHVKNDRLLMVKHVRVVSVEPK